MSTVRSTIDYLSKDYEGLRAAMLDHASRVMPEWQSRSEGDFGVTLVELMAYMGDVLSYYGDRVQNESFLPTATQRSSLLQIAGLLGYIPSNGVPSTGTVTLQSANPGPAVVVPAGTQVSTDYIEALDAPLVFETDTAVEVPANGGTVAVAVTHGITRTDIPLGISDGTAGQRFRVPETSVINGSVRVLVDSGTNSEGIPVTEEWTYYPFLVDSDGNDKAFTTYVDETGATWVEFGDNINGLVPNTGLNVFATYRVGGGQVGNIAANLDTGIASTDLIGVSVAVDSSGVPVSSAMTGGADPETNEQIRANAPRVFRSQNRAVTETDFSDLAIAVPGVLRASTVAGTYTSVTVYIVGPNGQAPSDSLRQRVEDTLQAKALAGTSITTVAGPTIVPVNVGASGNPLVVTVFGNYRRSTVQTEVEKAVQGLLALDKADFGMRITASDFYAAIMSVPGVQFVHIPMIARADAQQSGTADMVFRPWEIPVLGSLNLTTNGGLL
jgi:uncharacterized phage protein gp47/JayE